VDFKEIGWEGTNWIRVVKGRDKRRDLVNAVMNMWVA
jgi:hypothetical protein